jgi:hypothetical protein
LWEAANILTSGIGAMSVQLHRKEVREQPVEAEEIRVALLLSVCFQHEATIFNSGVRDLILRSNFTT